MTVGTIALDLADIAVAASTRTLTQFHWRGARAFSLPVSFARVMSETQQVQQIRAALTQCLYENYYCTGQVNALRSYSSAPLALDDDRFRISLAKVNLGTGPWEPGWQVKGYDKEAGTYYVSHIPGGLTVAAPLNSMKANSDDKPQDAARRASGQSPLPLGATVSLHLSSSLPRLQPGFFTVIGNVQLQQNAPIIRLYWNLTPQGAVRLIRQTTRVLNDRQLPFRCKVANSLTSYRRADSGVLYMDARSIADWWPLMRELHDLLRGGLKIAVPALTKRVDSGLGMAEDPGDGSSFGIGRCSMLASALVDCWSKGINEPRQKELAMSQSLIDQGVDLQRPHRRPGSLALAGYD